MKEKMTKIKITVVKTFCIEDIFGKDLPNTSEDFVSPCDRLSEGQEYFLEGIDCPKGFCNWAYADIQRDIVHLFFGGDYPWMKEKEIIYATCTDGLRPVVFKIERIEE